MIKTARLASSFTLAVLLLAGVAFAQTDPGVQSGNRGTGAALSSVLSNSPSGILAFFTDGQTRFQEVESVSGGANNGLGPRFNSNSCSSCHAQPSVGGTGAATNPQFSFTSNGVAPGNTMPSFITANGPTREARFPFFFNSNGSVNTSSPNGGVEDSVHRDRAVRCRQLHQQYQPAAAQLCYCRVGERHYLPDSHADLWRGSDRESGRFNSVEQSGAANHNNRPWHFRHFQPQRQRRHHHRFGWKAQNKSLHIFAGEAYNVEMGISNLLFPQDRPLPGEDGAGGSGELGCVSTCLNLSGSGLSGRHEQSCIGRCSDSR